MILSLVRRFARWILRGELASLRRQREDLGRELTQRRRLQKKLCPNPDCRQHIWIPPEDVKK